ncbi:MAG TPA: methylmalonyl-CoA mutase family protein [Thermoanaerobacterales bacterium]|nr:methylmalonyl-CoA mutase family protein [Thermoanaerobacterales bacterium]
MYKDIEITDIESELKKWEGTTLKKSVELHPERNDCFKTDSDIEIKEVFTPLDIKDMDYLQDINFPGEYPFTRGVQPTMYRSKYWTMRQYAGFGTAEETNKRFKFLLQNGQTGLSVAFDLPTQIGYDSDNPISEGEVGRAGVVIDSLQDMEILFDGIPLDKVSTSMTINAPAVILLAMYIALAEKQNIPINRLSGTIQNDILKEYIARGTFIFPPKPSMRLVMDIFEYCTKHMPSWNTISISGYHIREAGATAVQEIAFTLANGIAYVEAAKQAGLEVDNFAPRLSFFFNAHNNFFEEIAKFRAARRMWAKIMKHRFGATNEKSMKLRFHTQTAGSTLTAQQPANNIIRVTLQALAAVLGGTQSLHTNSNDEALALPSQESAMIALRTQQIIAYESGVADTVDPLAGSYYIEYLTNQIENKAQEYIDKIDMLGGAVNAIEKGFMQKEIQRSAYNYQKEIENKERLVVGVNEFIIDEEPPKGLSKFDPKVEKCQKEKLLKLKKNRDNEKVKRLLNNIKEAAKTEENIIPPIIESVKSYATLGEICDVLRQVFGEYKSSIIY